MVRRAKRERRGRPASVGGWWPWNVLRTRPSLALGGGMVLICGGLVLFGLHPAPALLVGFDVGALVFFAAQWRQFGRATQDQMRERARSQDAGRWASCGVGWRCRPW